MAIGTDYAKATKWVGSASTSDTITMGAAVTENDTIVIVTYRTNESSPGRPNASATNFTHVGQFDPGTSWRGVIDVLVKDVTASEDTTTPTYTVNWGETREYGVVLMAWCVPGADINSFQISTNGHYSATSCTFDADALDESWHILGNNNQVDQSTDFPSGDGTVSWENSGSWRRAGFARSGGSTASGTFTNTSGSFLTVSASASATGLVCDQTAIAEGAEREPNSACPTISVDITAGASNVKTVQYTLDRGDGYTWNDATPAWVAGAGTINEDTSLNQATPYTHNFSTNLPGDLGEGQSYVLKVRAADQADLFGNWDTTNFTSGTWTSATSITFTTDVSEIPTIAVTSHTDQETLAAGTTSIPLAGTAADDVSVSSVEVRYQINGGGFGGWATATGTTSWSYSITPVADGDVVDIEARSYDGSLYSTVAALQVDIAVPAPNAAPTIAVTSHFHQQVLSASTTSIDINGTASDSDGTVTSVTIRYNINDGPMSGVLGATNTGTNFSTWEYNGIGPVTQGDDVKISSFAWDNDGAITGILTQLFVDIESPTVYDTSPVAATYATAQQTDFYRVLYADVQSGAVHGELPVTGFAWQDVLNGAGTINATVVLEPDNASPAYTAENLRPGRTAMWISRDGVLLMGGILAGVQGIDLDANTASLVAQGFHAYFARRHIRINLDYSAVDQLTIARGLIDLAATDIRLSTDSATSGVNRDRSYRWWNMKPIGEAVEDLAGTINGFDFRYDYSWVNNLPTATFTTIYPNTGPSTEVRFDVGSNCAAANIEVDGTQLGNTAITLGSGDEAATTISVVTDPAGLDGIPIYEDVDVRSTVVNTSTLTEHGQDRLKRLAQPIDRVSVRLYPDVAPKLGGFAVGDQVTVSGSRGWWSASGTYRIVAYNTTVDVDGNETTIVDLVPLKVFT